MKIAFPSNGKIIASHFGYCANFQVFEVDSNKTIVSQSTIENPGEHKPGVLPQVLREHGINLVIVDGIGQNAIQLFNQNGIKVITGANGLIEDILRQFLSGALQTNGNICSH